MQRSPAYLTGGAAGRCALEHETGSASSNEAESWSCGGEDSGKKGVAHLHTGETGKVAEVGQIAGAEPIASTAHDTRLLRSFCTLSRADLTVA